MLDRLRKVGCPYVTDQPDPVVAKWVRWIEGPLVDDVVALHFRRQIWRGINGMATATPGVGDYPSAFWDYNRDCYVVTQAIGIRRLADMSRGVISLAKLIDEMKTAAKASRFTRATFLSQWGVSDDLLARRAEEGWRLFAGGGEHFDSRLADADLEILRGDSENIKDYVDQYVAHRAERPKLTDVPTFEDLHRAIDDLGDMFKKYSQVLKAAHWATLEPVGQEDWRAIFRVPWNQPDPPVEPWT